MKFGIGKMDASNKRATAQIVLNTIEEERHETQTSNYYDVQSMEESRANTSHQIRYSANKEFEFEDDRGSKTKLPIELFNKSLSKEDMQRLPFSTRSNERGHEIEETRKKVS